MELKGGKFGYGFVDYCGERFHVIGTAAKTQDDSLIAADFDYDNRMARHISYSPNVNGGDPIRTSMEVTAVSDSGRHVSIRWRGKKRLADCFEVCDQPQEKAGRLLLSVYKHNSIEYIAGMYVICTGSYGEWNKESDTYLKRQFLKFGKAGESTAEPFDPIFNQRIIDYMNEAEIPMNRNEWNEQNIVQLTLAK